MSKRALTWLTRGMLAVSLLGWVSAEGPERAVASVWANEIDCEAEANLKDWDCIQKRNAAQQGAPAAGPPAQDAPADAPPAPDAVARAGDAMGIVFTLEDAGKEADAVLREEGTDERGAWARSRFERGRDLGASRLGPNVIDTKAWIAKDVETAKALFKSQAEVKNFRERAEREGISGSNDRFKLENVAEETHASSAYWDDATVWHHYRVVVRKDRNVAVMYLFGRRELIDNGLVDWFSRKLAGRL